jgi:hypothetical protein
MTDIDFVVRKQGDRFISQCLRVDISSTGGTLEESIENLKLAVEQYFEDEALVINTKYQNISPN